MKEKSTTQTLFRTLLRNKSLTFGLAIFLAIVTMAIFADFIMPHDPMEIDLSRRLAPPDLAYPFGTDSLGRDLVSRVILGARTSVLIAGGSVGLALAISIIPGTLAGYFVGSRLDDVIRNLADILLTLPSILIAIAIVAALGAGVVNVILSVCFANIGPLLRVVRSSTIAIKNELYVEASRAIGESTLSIVSKVIVPNVIGTILTYTMLRMGEAILIGSSLSFLGLGVQPPDADWGLMVSEARDFIPLAPHAALIPGFFIAVSVLGINFLGDSLTDILNPRRRRVLD